MDLPWPLIVNSPAQADEANHSQTQMQDVINKLDELIVVLRR